MPSASVSILQEHPVATMAGLGFVSGILSATLGFMFEPEWLKPIAHLLFLEPGMVPIGAFYGAAMGLGLALCTGRVWAVPLQFITVLIAWSAAIHVALALIKVGDGGQDHSRNLLAGLAAGAVGASLTHVGAALVAPSLWRPAWIVLTALVGTVVGVLYVLGEMNVVHSRLLYIVWQPAVAWCIGLGMAGTVLAMTGPATSAAHRP